MTLMCGCDDMDGPSVFREKTVKARKLYKCYECGTKINPGELCDYIFGVWEGDVSSFYTCEKCVDLRDSLSALGFCMNFGSLIEDHQEYITEYIKKNGKTK